VAGPLGYPIASVLDTRDGDGTFAVFETGRVWWSARTGAKPVSQGPLLKRYRKLGAASGRLGFPTTKNYRIPRGARLNLEQGFLIYDKNTKRVTVTYR
jgi:uncharacterized protein with LGFP repeats